MMLNFIRSFATPRAHVPKIMPDDPETLEMNLIFEAV